MSLSDSIVRVEAPVVPDGLVVTRVQIKEGKGEGVLVGSGRYCYVVQIPDDLPLAEGVALLVSMVGEAEARRIVNKKGLDLFCRAKYADKSVNEDGQLVETFQALSPEDLATRGISIGEAMAAYKAMAKAKSTEAKAQALRDLFGKRLA